MKKPNSYASASSKLGRLTDAQRDELARWLIEERLSYPKAKLRLQERFGIQTSEAALSGFWKRVCDPRLTAARLTTGGKVLLDLQISAPARLQVIQFGSDAVIAIGEKQEGAS